MHIRHDRFPIEPALLKGGSEHWPALRRWSWEFLDALSGDALALTDAAGDAAGDAPLSDYLRALRAGDGPLASLYASGWRFFERHPEMLADFDEPHEAKPDVLQRIPIKKFKPLLWIFIGPHGSGTRLHYDVLDTHAWLATIQGRKRIAMHPPGPLDDDYERYRAEACEVLDRRREHGPWRYFELSPGDVLLIPSRWWHEVVNDGLTLGLTRNFATPDIQTRVANAARAQALGTLMPWLEDASTNAAQERSTQ